MQHSLQHRASAGGILPHAAMYMITSCVWIVTAANQAKFAYPTISNPPRWSWDTLGHMVCAVMMLKLLNLKNRCHTKLSVTRQRLRLSHIPGKRRLTTLQIYWFEHHCSICLGATTYLMCWQLFSLICSSNLTARFAARNGGSFTRVKCTR